MKPRFPTAAVGGTTSRPPAQATPVPATTPRTAKRSPSDPDVIMLETKQESPTIEMLMNEPVTIEYGTDLGERRTIHEGMLLHSSQKLRNLYANAQHTRKGYAKCKKISDQVEDYIMQELTPKDVQQDDTEQQIVEFITNSVKDHPFPATRELLRKDIISSITEQIDQKRTKQKKKDFRETPWQARLAALDSEGLLVVLDCLSAKLRKLKVREKEIAKKDPLKAAAQRRLILHNEKDETVQALLAWIYQEKLEYRNADQLYAIYRLADELGVEMLADTCLTKLCNDTSSSLQHARVHKLPLQYLLGYGLSATSEANHPDVPIDNVVAIVFKHMTRDEGTPKQLLRIFVDALAESLDAELWESLRDVLSRDKMAALIEALLALQVKTEQTD